MTQSGLGLFKIWGRLCAISRLPRSRRGHGLDSTQDAAKRDHDICDYRNPEGSLATERGGDDEEDNQRSDGKD